MYIETTYNYFTDFTPLEKEIMERYAILTAYPLLYPPNEARGHARRSGSRGYKRDDRLCDRCMSVFSEHTLEADDTEFDELCDPCFEATDEMLQARQAHASKVYLKPLV